LEDAIASHVILIVLDVADRSALMQYETVQSVLDEIGADQQPRILLLNKADRLQGTRNGPDPRIAEWMERVPGAMAISALTGDGLPELSERVLALMKGDVRSCTLSVPLSDSRAVDFVEKRVPVLGRDWTDAHVELKVEIGRRQLEQLLSSGVRMLVNGLPAHEGLRALWPDAKVEVAPRVRPHDSYAVGQQSDEE
jgi:GTP-binding protein HflX